MFFLPWFVAWLSFSIWFWVSPTPKITVDERVSDVGELIMITLPETNSSHLKMDGWNTSFVLGWPIFRCYVSFREGTLFTWIFLHQDHSFFKAHIELNLCLPQLHPGWGFPMS